MHLLVELCNGAFQVDACQCITDRFGTHTRHEGIFTILVLCLQELLLGEQLALFEWCLAGVDDEVVL